MLFMAESTEKPLMREMRIEIHGSSIDVLAMQLCIYVAVRSYDAEVVRGMAAPTSGGQSSGSHEDIIFCPRNGVYGIVNKLAQSPQDATLMQSGLEAKFPQSQWPDGLPLDDVYNYLVAEHAKRLKRDSKP